MRDQGIISPRTRASLSDHDITVICGIFRRLCGFISGRMPDRGNQISILVVNYLKISTLMFKIIECCYMPHNIDCINSRRLLQYQHQWELEQKKTDNLEVTKVEKSNCAKTMEVIVLHLKIVRGLRGVQSAYVVRQHLKEYDGYLKLDDEMIAIAPIVDSTSNLKMTQDSLDTAYVDC